MIKKLFILTAFFSLILIAGDKEKSFHDFTVNTIDGKEVKLEQFKGKVLLVVNVASKGGYTYQYEGLEALYSKYKNKGFAVLGFPANNFKQQEPGTNEEILAFCTDTYAVDFPMFAKISVKGDDIHPLYHYLTTAEEKFAGDITWNFNKFLISPDGKIVKRFGSKVEPQAKEIKDLINKYISK